jgi:hypothetical protein
MRKQPRKQGVRVDPDEVVHRRDAKGAEGKFLLHSDDSLKTP